MNRPQTTLSTKMFSVKAFAFAASCAICMGSASAKDEDFSDIKKDLEIMNSVLITALKQNQEKSSVRFRSLQSTYLAKQGVVFEVDTSAQRLRINFHSSSDFPAGFVPPPPPLPAVSVRDFVSSSATGTVSRRGHNAQSTAQLNELASELKETMDQLREVQGNTRDLTWKLRELEREKQDLSFELRNAEQTREKEINQKLADINEEQAEIKRQQEAQQVELTKVKQAQKEKRERSIEANKKAQTAFLTSFEQSVTSNLCRFGAGLRSLPSDENITFILEGFNQGVIHSFDETARSRIYVFRASDVKKCVQEKVNEKGLLAAASVYDF
jgi:uncharacterized phage infection (PIP) family protein YhgE